MVYKSIVISNQERVIMACVRYINNKHLYFIRWLKCILLPMSNKYLNKGFIQQLRGQEEGEGVCKKSTFVHPGGSGALECPRGPKFEKKIQLHQKVICNGR